MSAIFSFYLSAFAILLVIGSILGWVSLAKIRKLEARLDKLQSQWSEQNRNQATGELAEAGPAAPIVAALSKKSLDNSAAKTAVTGKRSVLTAIASGWIKHLNEYWMVWLGGLCVALAGIFLVRYSIDRGLLGPVGRITLALAFGLSLHAVAEYLRRRFGRSQPSLGALAGAASIILYAAVLAALHLYLLLPPGLAFALLVVIATATMATALLHGPVLAIIGILGAYVVPVLIFDDSSNILSAMIYSLIISGAALVLMRYVYRGWLYYGFLVGSLGWWSLSLLSPEAEGFRGYYLAILGYGILAVPTADWALRLSVKPSQNTQMKTDKALLFGLSARVLALILIIFAQTFSIAMESFADAALLHWSPLVLLVLWASRARDDFAVLPWFSLLSQWLAWLFCAVNLGDGRMELTMLSATDQANFVQYALGMTAIYSGFGWWSTRVSTFSHARFSLPVMAPVCWLALAYLLVTDLTQVWDWSLIALALGLLYIHLAQQQLKIAAAGNRAFWLILAGHLAYSLAVAMLLREASLTLALATQLLSLTWLIRRFELPDLAWLVKFLLAVLVTRLTFNPWLLSYPVDVHWSLWTYGGTTLCCFVAARLVPANGALRRWLEAVALQLFVLFAAAEVRYWLYDGQIFYREYRLLEAAINTVLWASVGLVYFYRAQLGATLRPFYLALSRVLLVMACGNYLLVLTVLNPLWGIQQIAATPVFNLLLPAYALPPLLAVLANWMHRRQYATATRAIAATGTFIFISLEIRHLWHGALDIALGTSEGELYTYSVVWMTMALLAILSADRLRRKDLYRAGMALLLLVIAKLFLIDMAGLEGLWRVASFMGLGLSLLGLAYLHQRMEAARLQEK